MVTALAKRSSPLEEIAHESVAKRVCGEKTTRTPLRGIYNIKGEGIPPPAKARGILPEYFDELPKMSTPVFRQKRMRQQSETTL